MCTVATLSISPRATLRAPSWIELSNEAEPRRTYRSETRRERAYDLIAPFTRRASASGAPAIQLPIPRRGTPGMTARIEPSFFFDANPNLEN